MRLGSNAGNALVVVLFGGRYAGDSSAMVLTERRVISTTGATERVVTEDVVAEVNPRRAGVEKFGMARLYTIVDYGSAVGRRSVLQLHAKKTAIAPTIATQ